MESSSGRLLNEEIDLGVTWPIGAFVGFLVMSCIILFLVGYIIKTLWDECMEARRAKKKLKSRAVDPDFNDSEQDKPVKRRTSKQKSATPDNEEQDAVTETPQVFEETPPQVYEEEPPPPPPEVEETIDSRLALLQLREQLIAKDIAFEGYLRVSKSQAKEYVVLKPVGELLFYKEMISSGFGNVHINHTKTINIRNALAVNLGSSRSEMEQGAKKSKKMTRKRTSAALLEQETQFHIIQQVHIGMSATSRHSFFAPTKDLAIEWVRVLDCLVSMYQEQSTPLQKGMTPIAMVPPPPRTPNLPGSTIRREEEQVVFASNPLSRTHSEPIPPPPPPDDDIDLPPINAVPTPPVAPMVPRKRHSSSKSGSKRRLRTKKSSSVPPPLPSWDADALDLANVDDRIKSVRRASVDSSTRRRSTSCPARERNKPEDSFERNNEIWKRFQNKL